MRSFIFFVVCCAALIQFSGAQTVVPRDRDGLLKGEGMGLASSAELNGYPGPKHVIQLRNELGLTLDQLRKAEALMEGVQASAKVIGQQVVDEEESLENLFQSGSPDERKVQSSLQEIGRLRADLRFLHLQAHLRMKEVLTPEQIQKYNKVRGHRADG